VWFFKLGEVFHVFDEFELDAFVDDELAVLLPGFLLLVFVLELALGAFVLSPV
jgi:hypothetical protein